MFAASATSTTSSTTSMSSTLSTNIRDAPHATEPDRFLNRSERVKSVEIHSTQPWLLTALHTGSVQIWNTDTHTLERTVQVGSTPVRAARFVSTKPWVVTGADDGLVRVFDVHTGALVTSFTAHADFVRYIDVHASKSLVLTCGDDQVVKLWDWEHDWACVRVFAGHGHYVMQAKFSPSDADVFASASLDRTVRVWSISTGAATATLEGHSAGVNCLDFFSGPTVSDVAGADARATTVVPSPMASSSSSLSSYLLSGADDATVKVWDLATGALVRTLVGHTNNVTAVLKHPHLPLIVSAAEDDTVRTWDAATLHAETVIAYDLCRAWCLSALPTSTRLAIGFDHGSVVLDLAAAPAAATIAAASRPARL